VCSTSTAQHDAAEGGRAGSQSVSSSPRPCSGPAVCDVAGARLACDNAACHSHVTHQCHSHQVVLCVGALPRARSSFQPAGARNIEDTSARTETGARC
jgi:hypothetical protein